MITKQQELLILSNLRLDSRQSLTLLSRKIRLPVSTIHEKMRKYQSQVIRKHTTILDFAQLGYTTQVSMLLGVPKEEKELLKEYLMKARQINSCFKINNGCDFLVEAIFHSMQEAETFVELLESKFNLQQKQVHYIIDELKREDFLSSPDYVQLTGESSYPHKY